MRDGSELEQLNQFYCISAQLKCCVSPDAKDEVVYCGEIHTAFWGFEIPAAYPHKVHVWAGQTVEAALAKRLSEIFNESEGNITVQIAEMSAEEKVAASTNPAIHAGLVWGIGYTPL